MKTSSIFYQFWLTVRNEYILGGEIIKKHSYSRRQGNSVRISSELFIVSAFFLSLFSSGIWSVSKCSEGSLSLVRKNKKTKQKKPPKYGVLSNDLVVLAWKHRGKAHLFFFFSFLGPHPQHMEVPG